jgi:hypothetical protein
MLSPDQKVAVRVAAELFDHSSRVKEYLNGLGPGELGEHQHLVEALLHGLEDVEQETIKSFAELVVVPADSTGQAVATLWSGLRIFSKWFTAIHELLALLPRESISPQVIFSLEGCFPEFVREHRPSVVLGSLVNAFEFDFIEILAGVLPDVRRLFPTGEPIFVLELAICDSASPLAYAILAHEVGHALDSRQQISSAVVAEFVAEHPVGQKLHDKLCNWCRELCADLLAARVVGPAPVLSLLSMEYCVYPEYEIFRHSDSHPSTRVRLRALSEDLAQSGASDLVRPEVGFYDTAWHLSIENTFPDVTVRRQEEQSHDALSDVFILPMAERLRQRLLSLDPPVLPLQFSDASLERCVKRLRQGLPVSAQGEAPESLAEKVREHSGRRLDAGKSRREEFKTLCDQFTEAPLEVPQILLAACRRRSEILDGLYAQKRPLADRGSVSSFCNSMRELDSLIASSIVTSCVHNEVLSRLRRAAERETELD